MTTPLDQSSVDAAQDAQLRALASQIASMTKLPYDPTTIRKAIIAAVSDNATPPTVSLNISGDTDTLVSQVRTLNNYTPLVGQTVLLAKQGTEIFILGAISATNPYSVGGAGETDNGWLRATITNGTHGGNSNGDIYYRRILDHGSWKMQWRGGWAPGGSTTLIGAADALDPDYRPSSKRSLLAAREIQTGATALQFDFQTDGTVTLVGAGTTPSIGSASVSLGDYTDSRDTASTVSHSHGGAVATATITHDDGSHSHYWSGSASHNHSLTVSAPGWVSLNGVEYFL